MKLILRHSLFHLNHLSLLLAFLLTGIVAQAQYSVEGDMPCPYGDAVELDTVFYVPSKAMPFERCFYLKLTLPGKEDVSRFAITPIDRNGKSNASRRDYHLFLKSGWPSLWPGVFKSQLSDIGAIVRKRRILKDQITFSGFKNGPIHRIDKHVHSVGKNTTTEVILRVPPLEPNRDYHVSLIGISGKVSDALLNSAELIVGSQREPNLKGTDMYREAEKIYNDIVRDRNKDSPIFKAVTFDEYIRFFTSFSLSFAKKGDDVRQYKLLFTPAGGAAPDPATVTGLFSVSLSPASTVGLDTLSKKITLPITDTQGNKIKPLQNGTYKIYLYTTYTTKNKALTIEELGDFTSKDNGVTYEFKANATTSKSLNPRLILGPVNVLNEVSKKREELQNLTIQLPGCLTPAVLATLMNEVLSCPCTEKGENMLLKKDDLTRTISLLFENNPDLHKRYVAGLNNLKEPLADVLEEDKYVLRLTNIQTSINQINDLIEFSSKAAAYNTANAANIKPVINCLNTIKDSFKQPIDLLTSIIKNRGEVRDGFIQEMTPLEIIKNDNTFLGSTSMLDLVSDNKFRIMPDFGFIVPFTRGRSGFFQDFTPYLGFNVNFRSTDKNIPFRMIRYKSWKHYLSFMAGLTMRSLKIENQRDDFFDKSSLITGLGLRYNHWLRLTSGLVWFKTKSPNPLSDATLVRASPFMGISVDLDLQELFGGIKTLFK